MKAEGGRASGMSAEWFGPRRGGSFVLVCRPVPQGIGNSYGARATPPAPARHADRGGRSLDFLMDLESCIPSLRRYARALLHDGADADDLVQDCLERAIARR